MSSDNWTPDYAPWRHGGWYVLNVHHPNGGCGCVSRDYPDRKWRIVCDPRPGSHQRTYATRDAAARAERDLTLALAAERAGEATAAPAAGETP